MITQRLLNVAFRQPMPISFMFSTKKKQMELTIRTPYRIILITQKPLLTHSQDLAESSPKLNNLPSSFKTEHHQLFTFFLLDISDLNLHNNQKASVTNTFTQVDGLSFIRIFII